MIRLPMPWASLCDPPRWLFAILTRPVEADQVAARISQPRFTPQPTLVGRTAFKAKVTLLQRGDARIEVLALEIHVNTVPVGRNRTIVQGQRERGVPLRAFKARIMIGAYDEPQARRFIERRWKPPDRVQAR
jgi:hypothetical protein